MELERLHAVVPATEEEDLLEQVRLEREAAETGGLLGVAQDEPARAPEAEDEPPFSEPQVLGMLEHHLGAHVVDRVLPPEGAAEP